MGNFSSKLPKTSQMGTTPSPLKINLPPNHLCSQYDSWDQNGDRAIDLSELRFKTSEQIADFFENIEPSNAAKKMLLSLPVPQLAGLLFVESGKPYFYEKYIKDLNPDHLRKSEELTTWYKTLQEQLNTLDEADRKPDTFSGSAKGLVCKLLESAYAFQFDYFPVSALPSDDEGEYKKLDANSDGQIEFSEIVKMTSHDLDVFFRKYESNENARKLFSALPETKVAQLLVYMNYMRPYEMSYFEAIVAKGYKKTAQVIDALMDYGRLGRQNDKNNIVTVANAKVLADRLLFFTGASYGQVLSLIQDPEYKSSRTQCSSAVIPRALLNPETFFSTYAQLESSSFNPNDRTQIYTNLFKYYAETLPSAKDLSPYIDLTQKLFRKNPNQFLEWISVLHAENKQQAIDAMLVFLGLNQLEQLLGLATLPEIQRVLMNEIDFNHANLPIRSYSETEQPPNLDYSLVIKKYGAPWCNPCFGERQTFHFWAQYFNRYYPQAKLAFADLDLGAGEESNPIPQDWMALAKAAQYEGMPAYEVVSNGKRVAFHMTKLTEEGFFIILRDNIVLPSMKN